MKNAFLFAACALSAFAMPTVYAADEVQLVSAFSAVRSYRGYGTQDTKFVFKVKDFGQNKAVFLHYKDHQGSWESAEAQYSGEAGDGHEYWKLTKSFCTNIFAYSCTEITRIPDLEFAVKYVVDGQTYWDNFYSQNYHLGENDGYNLHPHVNVVAEGNDVVNAYAYNGTKSFYTGNIILRNIAPDKTVKVVYTLNNWQTRFEGDASFNNVSGSFPLSRYTNPGINETHPEMAAESWSFTTEISNADPKQEVKWFVKYEVNGQTYIDNNFGQNYSTLIPDFPSVYLRGTHNSDPWSGEYPMQRIDDPDEGTTYWYGWADVSGHAEVERFKFDIHKDWSENYGDDSNNGYKTSGTAERNQGSIKFTEGPGEYEIRLYDNSHKYTVVKSTRQHDYRRTLIFIKGQTVPGQDMFLRGGIDWTYAKDVLGIDCSINNDDDDPWNDGKWDCAIPITHRLFTDDPSRMYDRYIDWYGEEVTTYSRQGEGIEGSPLVWTTNNPNHGREVINDGYGYTPLNTFGDHYWMLDIDMYCPNGVKAGDDYWFEVKSYISNGPGWEKNVSQPGAPYDSINHFAQCGKINVFERGKNEARILDF